MSVDHRDPDPASSPAEKRPILVAWTTLGDRASAETLANRIIDLRIAACVQLDGPIKSFYQWDGRRHRDSEYRLTIKTASDQGDVLRRCVLQHHPYDTPQYVAVLSTDVTDDYADWVVEQTRR